MRDTEREREAEGEAGSMREPDVGLDPRSPGSHPGLKAGAKLLSHPGCPCPSNSVLSGLIATSVQTPGLGWLGKKIKTPNVKKIPQNPTGSHKTPQFGKEAKSNSIPENAGTKQNGGRWKET